MVTVSHLPRAGLNAVLPSKSHIFPPRPPEKRGQKDNIARPGNMKAMATTATSIGNRNLVGIGTEGSIFADTQ